MLFWEVGGANETTSLAEPEAGCPAKNFSFQSAKVTTTLNQCYRVF